MLIDTPQPRLHTGAQLQQFHAMGWFGDKLLIDYLDGHALATPDKAAIIEVQRTLGYREVARMSENLAASLLALGVGRGDVVAVQAPNWAELPIVHFATDRIGAIFLPLSEGFRERELRHLLRQSQARAVFCPVEFRGHHHVQLIESMRDALPDLAHVIALRGAQVGGPTFDGMSANDAWRSAHGAQWLVTHRAGADDPSHVMVSSGTTGLPRCSLYSDNNTLVKLIRQYGRAAQIVSTDVAAAFAPAGTGATGYNYPILSMLLAGATSVMLEHWSGSRVASALALLEQHRCTLAVVVPTQLAQLVQVLQVAQSGGARFDALRVITNSGAKLPPSVAEAAERLFDCKVQCIYGSSEAGATSMTRVDDPVHQRHASAGRPLDGQEVKIIADDGSVLEAGEAGEVCWRGANKSYGFLNDAETTAQVWGEGGWLHSGDLGCIDSEGYLHIVGRKKDMIIRGGQNINPGAIEEVLARHPDIAEVAIVPFSDTLLGERIAACVVPRAGIKAAPMLESLKSLVMTSGMAVWQQPELLLPLRELPRNAGGKIDKKSLSRLATAAATEGASPKP